MSLNVVTLLIYGACLVIMLVFSLGQFHLLVIYRRRMRMSVEQSQSWAPVPLPMITIQLPVYNERHVIRRLINAVSNIDYPLELLEIQVLDDSNDDTVEVAAEMIRNLRSAGFPIIHVRRPSRVGFKAGALAHGLTMAHGDFIAIFDADFLPTRDFLQRTVPYFVSPEVAVVQTRWGYINRNQSVMTRVQAFMLDLHFRLEQPARYRNGLFLNFNGTAGLWRKAAIIDAGGWSTKTLTEDIDLSYRAQLRGWKLIYLDNYACPGELPTNMNGIRSQQYRWLKGGAENARQHLVSVICSEFPFVVRAHAALHLLAGSIYLALLSALLMSVPLTVLKNTSISVDYVDYGTPFVISTLAMFAVFHGAQHPAPSGMSGYIRFMGSMLLFLVFTMGLSVHNSGAVLSGWLGCRSEFIRTPKFGDRGWVSSTYAGRSIDSCVVWELLVLGALLSGIIVGLHRNQLSLFPIQLMASVGLVWIISLSIIHPFCARSYASRYGGCSDEKLAADVSKEVVL